MRSFIWGPHAIIFSGRYVSGSLNVCLVQLAGVPALAQSIALVALRRLGCRSKIQEHLH